MPIVTSAFVVCFALLGVAGLASSRFNRPFGDFTRDPAVVLSEAGCSSGECTLIGFVSSLGALVWAASAACCLFVALILRLAAARPVRNSPYLYFGLLTALLVLDDEFLLHETAWGWVPGLTEHVVFAAYAVSALVILVSFRTFLARTSVWMLGLAAGCFGVSVGLDVLALGIYAAEDGAKLLGIAAWSTFLIGTASVEASRVIGSTLAARGVQDVGIVGVLPPLNRSSSGWRNVG